MTCHESFTGSGALRQHRSKEHNRTRIKYAPLKVQSVLGCEGGTGSTPGCRTVHFKGYTGSVKSIPAVYAILETE